MQGGAVGSNIKIVKDNNNHDGVFDNSQMPVYS